MIDAMIQAIVENGVSFTALIMIAWQNTRLLKTIVRVTEKDLLIDTEIEERLTKLEHEITQKKF